MGWDVKPILKNRNGIAFPLQKNSSGIFVCDTCFEQQKDSSLILEAALNQTVATCRAAPPPGRVRVAYPQPFVAANRQVPGPLCTQDRRRCILNHPEILVYLHHRCTFSTSVGSSLR